MNTEGSSHAEIHCAVLRAAPAAVEWLATSSSARPYHIFQSVCNLLNAEGDVISLMVTPAEMNPLGLELDCPDLDLTELIQPESEVRQEPDLLCVGELAIGLDSAATWDPFPDWGGARENCQRVQELIGDLTKLLIASHSHDSLVVFLNVPGSFSDSSLQAWQERAREPIARLLDGLEAGDTAAVLAGASNLAGLGMGLTPSGDDFIIGLMHALWCSLPPDEAKALCVELVGAVADRTNRLSASYLTRSALGEASQPWHALIKAMAQGDVAGMRSPADAIIGLGHTSGQDALAGFLLGLKTRHQTYI